MGSGSALVAEARKPCILPPNAVPEPQLGAGHGHRVPHEGAPALAMGSTDELANGTR